MKLQNIFTPCYCSDDKNDNSEIVSQETGVDRIKRMYRKTDFGFVSPELHYIIKGGTFACSFSAILGGIISANQARDDYMRRNTATQFESQHLARRRLADTISLSAIRGALKYGAKYGSFSTLYLLSTMTAANYNNKITVWEHIASGALIGGLFRFNYGLKGMAAAASAGAVLGAFAGGILVFSMWLTDTDFQNLRYWQSMTYYESRKSTFDPHQKDFLKRIE